MKRTTLRNALAAGVLAAASGYALQASAIPSFTFTEYGGFEGGDIPTPVGAVIYSNPVINALGPADASACPSVPAGPPCGPSGPVYSDMSWLHTNTGPYSSLNLVTETAPDAAELLAFNSGAWVTISTLTHDNAVIPEAFSWTGQDVWGRFIVRDSAVVLNSNEPITLDFNETPNADTLAGCDPNPNPSGSAIPCDDQFLFSAVGLADLFFAATDGSNWKVEFQLVPGAGAFVGCAGSCVFTAERTPSQVYVQARLVPNEIPEPVTLSLIGLGLLGLGFGTRRRQMPKAA